MKLLNPITRQIHLRDGDHSAGTVAVECELSTWNGVPLIVHRNTHAAPRLVHHDWRCTHEPTGWAIADGPSPGFALGFAVETLRTHWEEFQRKIAVLPLVNPPPDGAAIPLAESDPG